VIVGTSIRVSFLTAGFWSLPGAVDVILTISVMWGGEENRNKERRVRERWKE